MSHVLWKIFILIRKDFLETLSYRLNFLLETGSILFYVCVFYFISRMIPDAGVEHLEAHGGNFFTFVLIGLAFSDFLGVCLRTFSSAIRNEQTSGTLEALLATPTSISVVFAAKFTWNFIYGSLHVLIFFGIGVGLLGASYSDANLMPIPLIVLLSLVAFSALGMISAAFILVFKRGDPINMFLGFASALLGGVYFPVDVLPRQLQVVSNYVPITYVLRLTRDACIHGAGFRELAPDLFSLAALSAVLLCVGTLAFSKALKHAKRDGSLTHY